MLSTCNDRIGGQTALRNENGEVMNVKRATNGMHPDRHIPVPQTRKDRVRSWFERYIEHKALRALGIPNIALRCFWVGSVTLIGSLELLETSRACISYGQSQGVFHERVCFLEYMERRLLKMTRFSWACSMTATFARRD
ncbi:Pc22g18860 [Penicillium rubens Wisconsin 54-1255]|uniref:Pc22g18860 protein n=1 Tax=Penicillium rubens (strain ATCC 28089 / DSM 1075 / NRRL 1951 / Wisconsin 54-1255) TaxID=500485 RepID=B6HVD0_PENRW|nr:Pc22g18860 [Penicillium rubens Wisconsin 54-1255]